MDRFVNIRKFVPLDLNLLRRPRTLRRSVLKIKQCYMGIEYQAEMSLNTHEKLHQNLLETLF